MRRPAKAAVLERRPAKVAEQSGRCLESFVLDLFPQTNLSVGVLAMLLEVPINPAALR